MGKQMEVGKEAAQDRRVHENRPLKSRGEPGNQGGSQGRPLQGEGVCEQRHRGARGVVSRGVQASSQGAGFRAASVVLSRAGMGEV